VAKAYSIETVFKLIDQVSAPTSKVGKALDKLGIKSKAVSNALKNDFDKAAERMNKIGASAVKFAKYAAAGAVGAIGIGLGAATKQFIEFDSQLYKAGSIFSDLNPLADDFKTRLDAIGKAARKVAAATEFNAEQTAAALATMAMAGIKSEQAISLLPRVADMATAAGVDLDKAVGMAAGALNVFGKMTDDPIKLAENFLYVSDIMVRGANLADMSISDMSAAVSAGGARFKEANQRIEDFGAAVDILASVNRRGSEAGKAIGAIMTQLAAKPGDVSKALQELGIRTQDAQGNMLNFVDIIGQLNVAMNGMGTAKQDEYLFRIFGKNRMDYARPLIEAGVEGFRAYSRELDKAAGSTAQAAEVMRQSIKNKLAVMGSAATEMGFKFVEAFKDKAVAAIESATTAIENFDVAPLVGMASAAADGIMKFAGMLAGAVRTAWQFRYVIIAIAAPIAAYNAALMGITIAAGIFNKIMAINRVVTGAATGFQIAYGIVIQKNTAATAALAFVTNEARIATAIWGGVMKTVTAIQGGFLKLIKAIRTGTLLSAAADGIKAGALWLATGAQTAFNIAAAANPIGLIIMGAAAAAAALIAVIILVVKNWDKIINAVTRAVIWLKAFFSSLGKSISKALEPLINWLKNIWSSVVNSLTTAWAGVISFFKNIWSSVVNAFTTAWGAAVSFFKNIWNSVSTFFGGIWEGIAGVVSSVANWFTGVWQAVTGAFSAAWMWIHDLFVSIWESIKGTVIKFIDWLSPIIDKIIAPFRAIGEAIGSIISTVGGWFSDADKEGNAAVAAYDAAQKKTNAAAETKAGISKEVEAEITPPVPGSPPLDYPDFGIPGIGSAPGPGGKSKLHGVVDISGGAIPTVDGSGSYTATSAAGSSPASGTATSALTSYVMGIAATLQRIEGAVSNIARSLPLAARAELSAMGAPATATRMSPVSPQIDMGGGGDHSRARDISPITQAERTAYSYEEHERKIVIEVAAEKGTAARVVRAPRDADIQLVASGGN
jgi:TP901 family phage tail tape measure protein